MYIPFLVFCDLFWQLLLDISSILSSSLEKELFLIWYFFYLFINLFFCKAFFLLSWKRQNWWLRLANWIYLYVGALEHYNFICLPGHFSWWLVGGRGTTTLLASQTILHVIHPEWTKFRPLDSRTRFDLKFFLVLSTYRHPRKLDCTFLTTKVSTVIIIEGGTALLWSQNNTTSNIILITCFHYHDILVKTRHRMMTTVMFSCQNDAGSPMGTASSCNIEKITYS